MLQCPKTIVLQTVWGCMEPTASTPYYILCLKEVFSERKKRNPAYSLRAFAKQLDISASTLSQILSEHTVPSTELADKIVAKLALSSRKRQLFMASFAGKLELRKTNSNNIDTETKFDRIQNDLFSIVADVIHMAILELTLTEDFNPSPRSIAKQLNATEHDVRQAIERLIRLNLLVKEGGLLKRTSTNLTTADKNLTTIALRQQQKQVRLKAIEALENLPPEKRRMSSVTLAIDESKLQHAFQLLDEFCESLSEALQDGKKTKVYQFEVSFFPLQSPLPSLTKDDNDSQ